MRSGSPDGPGEVFLLSPGFISFRSPVAQKRSGDGEAKYFYGSHGPYLHLDPDHHPLPPMPGVADPYEYDESLESL